MIDSHTAPYGALLLRLTLGTLFLAHAALKIFVFTPAGTAGYFGNIGLPPALAYVVMTAEVLGGIALILGFWTRLFATNTCATGILSCSAAATPVRRSITVSRKAFQVAGFTRSWTRRIAI